MPTATPTIDNLELIAPLDLQATEGGKGPPKFSLLAYTGDAMRVNGFFDPVVIDLEGVTFDRPVTPVIMDHDVTKRVGHTTNQRVDSKGIFASGIVSSSSVDAQSFVADARAGMPFQTSVGCKVLDAVFVPEGQTVKANGRAFDGPVVLATKTLVRELSVTLLGADSGTQAAIVASAKSHQPHEKKGNLMTTIFGLFNKGNANTNQGSDIEAATIAERNRIKAIDQALRPPSGQGWGSVQGEIEMLRAKAIDGEVQLAELPQYVQQAAEVLALRDARPTINGGSGNGPAIHVRGGNIRASGDMLQTILLCRSGNERIAEKVFGEQVLDAASRYRSLSFPDICAMALQAEGRDVPISRDEMIRASFSTNALTTALGGSMDKLLAIVFAEAGATWRSFAAKKSLANFREHTIISPQHRGQLLQVPNHGEVKNGYLTEDLTTIKLATYAKIISVGRHDVVNDDLGIFDDVTNVFAVQAARTLNDLVWEVIMANAGSFFDAGHANLLSGGTSPLSLTSLAAAVQAMRKQKDADNNDLDIAPKVLAVPPELEVTARELLTSIEIKKTNNNSPTGNALKEIATLEVEPRLSNTAKFANASATAWFLFSGPSNAPVYVGCLDGREAPVVEAFGLDSDPHHFAYKWRVFGDWGSALGEYRSAVKSLGA
jgi:hypothetical protein